MKRFMSKKVVAIGMAAGLALGAAGAAFAYLTDSGSGTGSATVGAPTAFTIVGSTTGNAYPGAAGQAVTFSVTNPGSGNQELGTITLTGLEACASGSSYLVASGGNTAGCYVGGVYTGAETSPIASCSDFSAAASNPGSSVDWWMAPVTEAQDITHGATVNATNNGLLVMNDTLASQDACENANIWMSFSSSDLPS